MNLSVSVNLVHDDHLHSIADLSISTNMDINEVLDKCYNSPRGSTLFNSLKDNMVNIVKEKNV